MQTVKKKKKNEDGKIAFVDVASHMCMLISAFC